MELEGGLFCTGEMSGIKDQEKGLGCKGWWRDSDVACKEVVAPYSGGMGEALCKVDGDIA